MRIFISLTLLILITNLNGIGQNKVHLLGFRMAGSYGSLKNSIYKYKNNGLGYNISLTQQVQRTNKKIGVTLDMGISKLYSKDEYFTYDFHYLNISFLPNRYFEKLGLTAYAGGCFSFRLNVIIGNDYAKSLQSFKSFNPGLTLGINQKLIRKGNLQLNLDARFTKGIRNLRDLHWEGKTTTYIFDLGFIFSKIRNGDTVNKDSK